MQVPVDLRGHPHEVVKKKFAPHKATIAQAGEGPPLPLLVLHLPADEEGETGADQHQNDRDHVGRPHCVGELCEDELGIEQVLDEGHDLLLHGRRYLRKHLLRPRRHLKHHLKSTFAVTVYVWLCILLIFISIPWLLNMVEPNTSSGIRVSTTLASEENWYKAHYFDSLARIIGCCVTLVYILFMKLFFRKSTAWYNNGFTYLLVFLVPLLLSFFISTIYHTFILKIP